MLEVSNPGNITSFTVKYLNTFFLIFKAIYFLFLFLSLNIFCKKNQVKIVIYPVIIYTYKFKTGWKTKNNQVHLDLVESKIRKKIHLINRVKKNTSVYLNYTGEIPRAGWFFLKIIYLPMSFKLSTLDLRYDLVRFQLKPVNYLKLVSTWYHSGMKHCKLKLMKRNLLASHLLFVHVTFLIQRSSHTGPMSNNLVYYSIEDSPNATKTVVYIS